tara:strand:+ start:1122 stop:2288 length:1167 start_codon:yes stop_codon:yes gene_type:complete
MEAAYAGGANPQRLAEFASERTGYSAEVTANMFRDIAFAGGRGLRDAYYGEEQATADGGPTGIFTGTTAGLIDARRAGIDPAEVAGLAHWMNAGTEVGHWGLESALDVQRYGRRIGMAPRDVNTAMRQTTGFLQQRMLSGYDTNPQQFEQQMLRAQGGGTHLFAAQGALSAGYGAAVSPVGSLSRIYSGVLDTFMSREALLEAEGDIGKAIEISATYTPEKMIQIADRYAGGRSQANRMLYGAGLTPEQVRILRQQPRKQVPEEVSFPEMASPLSQHRQQQNVLERRGLHRGTGERRYDDQGNIIQGLSGWEGLQVLNRETAEGLRQYSSPVIAESKRFLEVYEGLVQAEVGNAEMMRSILERAEGNAVLTQQAMERILYFMERIVGF